MSAQKIKAAFTEPMLLLAARELPEGANWTYELKLDGYLGEHPKPATHDHLKGSSALLMERDGPDLHKTGLHENVLSSKSKWLHAPALCLDRFCQIHLA